MIYEEYMTESVNDIMSDLMVFVESANMDDPYEAEIVEHCEELFIEFGKKDEDGNPTGRVGKIIKAIDDKVQAGNAKANVINDKVARKVIKTPEYDISKNKIPNNMDYDSYRKKVSGVKVGMKVAEISAMNTVMLGPFDIAFKSAIFPTLGKSEDISDQIVGKYYKKYEAAKNKLSNRISTLTKKMKNGEVSKDAAEAEAKAIKASCLKVIDTNKQLADKGIIKLKPGAEKKLAIAESCIEDPTVNLLADVFAFESVITEDL